MKWLLHIETLEQLKSEYRKLALANHPDAGGTTEAMQEINNEYDILFPRLKAQYNAVASQPTAETAQGTRAEFYTQNGWKGKNYDSSLTLKEIAVLVRQFVKENYPTCKFSIRTEYASMCQELHVALMEAPVKAYKAPSEWTDEEREQADLYELRREAYHYSEEANRKWRETLFYTDTVKVVIEAVDEFVNSYNYDDSDGMIDYFDKNFYYFGCKIGKWDKPFKVVPRTSRLNGNASKVTSIHDTEAAVFVCGEIPQNFTVTEDIDTRDGSQLWVVKFTEKMEHDRYKEVAAILKTLNGYYSRFKHGFIFRYDPTEVLSGEARQEGEAKNQPSPKKQDTKEKLYKKQAAKINKGIVSLENKIAALSGNYKTNTVKRMREATNRSEKILGYKQDILILKYLLETLKTRLLSEFELSIISENFRESMKSYVWWLENGHSIKFPSITEDMAQSIKDEISKKQKRLKKAGINNTEDLTNMVMQYKTIMNYANEATETDRKQKEINDLENTLKFQQIGDVQFTPSEVVRKLIDLSKITSTSRVLEPSAGIGSIADEIKKITDMVDVCEESYDFRELLKLKSHTIVGSDFLEYKPEPPDFYDAIIMNPPFSNNQDIKHLIHAYELLKPGGRLVCLTSPHWVFAKEKKCVEFREWIENKGYYSEELACGTFEMTGVKSMIVVIDRSN